MAITDFLTADTLGLIAGIAIPIGGALIWLGTLNQRLKTLEKDTGKMQEEVKQLGILNQRLETLEENTGKIQDELRQLLIKAEADLIVGRAQEERRKEKEEEEKRRREMNGGKTQ